MPDPRRPSPQARRIARVVATWGLLTLGSVAALAVLIIWHLVRRGRLIRQNLRPPRAVRLPELDRPESPENPEMSPRSTRRTRRERPGGKNEK
ncbi:MAG TPA: hypothetical protein VF590_06615 [Isosphaeraceae bacterium]